MSRSAHHYNRRLLWLSLITVLILLLGATVQAAGAQEITPASSGAVAGVAVAQPAATNAIITLGEAANYAVLGYNILLHNTDIWGGPVGVGYNNVTGVGKMQVESPGVVHDAPVYKDPSATITGNTGPANLMQGIVTQELDQAFADAMTAYNAALALTPDYTVSGNIGSATTIAATHGGQYVIKITGNIQSQLVLTPFPGQTTKFVVIVEGTITLGGSDTVGASNAAGAQNVLIVVKGTGSTLTSHINNRVYGTMLAPYRQASFHGFAGAFIGGDLEAKFMSDCQINFVGYEPPADPPVCLGEAANFGILGLDNGSISINSATDIIGDVGYSRGLTSTTNQKAGDDGVFLGTVYVHDLVAAFSYTAKDFLPSGGIVGYPTGVPAVDSRLDQANADALLASASYASQPVNVNLGNLGDNDNRTVNRSGPVTVVQIGSWTYNSDILTLVGQAGQDDAFIVNVLGNLDFSQSEIRLTNVRPERVVFNFPNASTLMINKSATIWKGTILAPTSQVEYHNPASFEGAIIAKNITVHSDFNLTHRELDINCNVPVTPSIVVEKYVSVDNQDTWEDADSPAGPTTAAGTPVYFKFVVANTGNVTLSDVSLSDSDFSPLTGCAAPSSLAAGQDYQCVYGPVAAVNGQHSNTATASASYNGNPVQDTDPAHYFGDTILIGSIGDYVWNDIDGDGLQDDGANRGLNAVTVRLYQDDGDGAYEPGTGDVLLSSQDTAGDGNYLFASLTAGDYWVDVDETDLPGYTAIVGAESEPQPLFVELLPGEDFTVADFGYAGRGTVSGVVFYDWDESGDQGLGEDGIPNVEVCLYRDTDNDGLVDFGSIPISCLNTQPDGSYLFTNQLPGDYLVVETPPAGLENTTPIIRDVQLIVVGAGGSAPGNDFGHVNFGSIGDFIYLDSNGNGQQDFGENIGIAGVPVTVRNVSTLEETTVTSGPTGLYTVGDLAPGVYEVNTPASWPGLARTTVSPKTVNLGQGQAYVLADFGYIAPTAVQMASFTATAQTGGVLVRWATSYEREQEGFRVWRAPAAGGTYKLVSGVIVARNLETGASYEWLDTGASGGQYWYKVESLPDGQMYGPVGTEAEQGLTRRIFTPLVVNRR